MKTVLITGANRGLGLSLARAYQNKGYLVIATARDNDRVSELVEEGFESLPLDVTEPASVRNMVRHLKRRPICLLINNAGVGREGPPFDNLNFEEFLNVFNVNCVGPLRISHALLDNLLLSSKPMIVNISSILGSISLNIDSRWYAYRASKVALNMMTRNMAHDLKGRGICCLAVHPGWIKTRIGGSEANLNANEAAKRIFKALSVLSIKDSGSFIDLDGKNLPW
jgi:NAD(P)-dependent dehydrogenase (short-subunit alcohol dehydrogenase family)